ncbi:hypothetical protein BH24ACT26_BH24ACT26_23270 [soil metagenome]
MGARIDMGPPRARVHGGDWGWAELANGLVDPVARRVLRALDGAGIDNRSACAGGRTTVFVRRTCLDEARFVLATVSFYAPPARRPAGSGTEGLMRRPAARAAAALVAILAALLLWAAPWDANTDLRCPGKDNSYVRAIRGGCVHVDASPALRR